MQKKALATVESILGEHFDNAIVVHQHRDEIWGHIIIGSGYAGKALASELHDHLNCPIDIEYGEAEIDDDDDGESWRDIAEGEDPESV